MKRFILCLLAALFICGSAGADVLYWSDHDVGSNPFIQAMTELGLTYTVASGASDYNTKLGTGSYDTAVLLLQNWSYSPSTFSNMPTHIAGGGKAIFTDWTRNATMGSWFGVGYTGNNNQQPVNLTASFLQTGIVGPVGLVDPGWGIWSMGMYLAGATAGAYFPSGQVAIAYTSNTIVNGMLKDTFANYSQGLQLAKNELSYVSTPIPEPGTLLLLGSGLAGFAGYGKLRLRRRKK